jgi:hypothetical protein
MFPNRLDRLNNCPNWRSIFVQDNFLVLGYFAWAGFRLAAGGLLVCDVEPPPVGTAIEFHTWNFTTKFVPIIFLGDYLLELEIPATEIPDLVQSIASINFDREIALLIRADTLVEMFLLKDLAIYPPTSYLQVRDRWDEFMSNHLPPETLYGSSKSAI